MDRLKRGGRLSKREYAWKWSASIKVRAQIRRQVYGVVRLHGRATLKCIIILSHVHACSICSPTRTIWRSSMQL